ncbi:MAG TPA: hypothetical protein VG498_25955 [Terriglobales bacterium]|nr:hypothetical protein [Terriglobales bacterium]
MSKQNMLIAVIFLLLGIASLAGKWPAHAKAGDDLRNQWKLGIILLTVAILMFALVLSYPQS